MDRRRKRRKRTSKEVNDAALERRRGERRHEKRVAAEIMVEVETSGRRTYRRTANISAGGVGFHQPIPFARGSSIRLSLTLAGREAAVRVTGEVVGVDKNGRGKRVMFTNLSPATRRTLTAHLELFDVPTKIGRPPGTLPPSGRSRASVREGILIIEDHPDGLEFRLRGSDKIVGRDPHECDFIIDDASVSRRHAHIYLYNGRHVIVDLSSTNGINFRGRPIHSLVLNNGMVFKVGHVRLQYLVTKSV
ncbi:MAG TPA: PilZ domain-containing protein [Myxococcota bacterium]|nr:PilZ domain-containing protein [Myxococcota bacterium]